MAFRTTTSTSTWHPADEVFPRGVRALLVVTLLVYVVQQLAPPAFTLLLGLRPADVVGELRLWQPFTYMFLHGGFLHVLFNLLVLWMMGSAIERLWGTREFVTYYLACGLGAAALAFALPWTWDRLVIGASGAIFGVLTAFAVLFPHRTIYLWFVIPVPARYLVLILFGLEVLLIGSRDGVAHFAHVGGAVTGYAWLRLGLRDRVDPIGWWRRRRRPRLTVHPGGAPRPRRRAQEDEVDRILDKISRSGLQSLTPEESRTLEEASRGPRGQP